VIVKPGWKCARLSDAGSNSLAEWLEALAMDPADFYGIRGVSFTVRRRELGWLADAPHPEEERLAAPSPPLRPPTPSVPGERERRQWAMLFAQLLGTGRHWLPLGATGAAVRARSH